MYIWHAAVWTLRDGEIIDIPYHLFSTRYMYVHTHTYTWYFTIGYLLYPSIIKFGFILKFDSDFFFVYFWFSDNCAIKLFFFSVVFFWIFVSLHDFYFHKIRLCIVIGIRSLLSRVSTVVLTIVGCGLIDTCFLPAGIELYTMLLCKKGSHNTF